MNFSQEDIFRFWEKVDIKSEDECWNWTDCLDTGGYGLFKLNGKNEKANRCSLFLEKGEGPLDKPFALHLCKKNRKCCNPNHLYYGTSAQNKADQVKDGTIPRGETNGKSKLTEQQVREIREKYIPREYTYKKLAEEYGVVYSTIGYIINKGWNHLNPQN